MLLQDQESSYQPAAETDSIAHMAAFTMRRFTSKEALFQSLLTLVCSQLAIRTSFITEITPEANSNRIIAAHNQPGGVGITADTLLPLDETYCSVITDTADRVPLLIPDIQQDPAFTNHPARQASPRVHCFLGVPIVLADGRLYGTLCAVDTEPQPLLPRHGELLTVLAHFIAERIERDREVQARLASAVEREQLYHAAQEAVRERDAFLTIAAHELKNPLAALLGNAQVLQRRSQRNPALTERDTHSIATLVQQSERLTALVTDLLDVSYLESGHFALMREPLDLYQLVAHALADMQAILAQRPVTLTDPDCPVLVDADKIRLGQVVRNLVGNAAKYSPPDSPIDVQIAAQDGMAALQITDHGIGIPADERPYLFQRFYRVANDATRTVAGLGVGLHVVKEIVTRHGGTIIVENTIGVGSTFTVTIPLLA